MTTRQVETEKKGKATRLEKQRNKEESLEYRVPVKQSSFKLTARH